MEFYPELLSHEIDPCTGLSSQFFYARWRKLTLMTRIRAATSPSCGCWTSTRGPTSWPPPWASPWPTTTTRPSSETGKNKFHLVFLDFWNSSKEKIRAKWIKMKYNSFFLFSRLTTSLKMHQKGSWLKINFDFFSRGTFFFRHLWIKKWKKKFFWGQRCRRIDSKSFVVKAAQQQLQLSSWSASNFLRWSDF